MTDPVEPSFLQRAIALALDAAAAGQPPFGAVVVLDGREVGAGRNTTLRDLDPTAHAEVVAIRAACRSLETLELTGATLVTSCEPCPMCQALAALVGISRVVYASPKEWAAQAGFVLPPAAAALQSAMRRAAPDEVNYMPTPGADVPFQR